MTLLIEVSDRIYYDVADGFMVGGSERGVLHLEIRRD